MKSRRKSKQLQLLQQNDKTDRFSIGNNSEAQKGLRESLLSSDSQTSENSQSKNKQGKKKQTEKSLKDSKKKKFSWPVYKNFFKYTLRRWPIAISALFFTILSGLMTSLIPWKIGKVLDVIGEASQDPQLEQQFNNQIGMLVAIVIGFTLVHIGRFLSTQIIQEMLLVDMRSDIYARFINYDMKFFQQYKTGELVSRLGSDINQAKSAISNNLTFLIRNMVTIVGNIVVLLIISWKLTLYVLLIVPMYAIITLVYNRKNKALVREYQDIMAEMSSHVSEKFQGIQVVKAFSTEQLETQKYRNINDKGYNVAFTKTLWQLMYFVNSQFLPNVATIIVLWVGGKEIIDGTDNRLTPGQLTSFILYCTSLASNTSGISQSYANIINGTHAVQKVFEMLGYQPQVDEQKGEQRQITGQVQFKNVCFKYPKAQTPIITDFNLKFRQGQYVALVGQSGSGKSTIVKLIQRFYKLQQGQVYFGNHDAEDLNIKFLRSQIGLVNQEATLFAGTIQDNIAYGLKEYSFEELQEAARKSGCLEFINNPKLFPLAFKTQIGERGAQLSGGQRQRISIARALMRKPKILIFDQATSALDTNSQHMVQQSIEILSEEQKKMTIIVIAHRLSTVINAQRIIAMKEGSIIQEGTHNELKARKGYYYDLVQKQLTQQHKDFKDQVPGQKKNIQVNEQQ